MVSETTNRPGATTSVAVLGTGSIGARHLDVLRSMEGVEPIAVPMRKKRIGQLEEEGYSTASDLGDAATKGAALCIIATDTSRHVQDGIAAMDLEMDLLVEKPMAIDAAEARRLQARAKDTGRSVFVGCVLRFSESLNEFRKSYCLVGKLHSVHIESQSYLPDWRPARPYLESYSAREQEGGILRDMIHEVDYAAWIFGWPASVQARLKNLGRLDINAEEMAELRWETAGGALVSVALDYLSRPPRRRIRACGDQGTIEWDGVAGTVTLSINDRPVREIHSYQERNQMFLAQAQAFISAVKGIPGQRLATGQEGVQALAICDAARRSSDSAKQEAVDLQWQ